MGLFSDSKRITVATQVSRVVQDDALPNAVKTGVLTALLQNGEIVDNVLEHMIGSVGIQAERMYDYAADHYTHGLPSGAVHSNTQGAEAAQAVIEAIEGAPISIDYFRVGPPNKLHTGWMKLIELYGYDPATNKLPGLPSAHGDIPYLEDLQVVIPAGTESEYLPGSLDQWGVPARFGVTHRRIAAPVNPLLAHTPVLVVADDPLDHVLVTYSWREDEAHVPFNVISQASLKIYLTEDERADYFMVKYTVAGVTKYWMYRAGLGTYPTLDALVDAEATLGTFFPFTYFRFNKEAEGEDPTAKKMLKYLGMNYDAVVAGINENPDIDDVEQAMMMFAVPAESTHPLELRYLYDFFDEMFLNSAQYGSPTQEQLEQFFVLAGPATPKQVITIQDARFKMSLANSGIYKKRVTGVLGPIGTHASEITARDYTINVRVSDGEGGGTMQDVTTPLKVHRFRRQVSSAQYDEIEVVQLQTLYHIMGHYTVLADDVDDILIIPLDLSITQDYQIKEREELYSRSLHYVFNSVIIEVVKWYQTEFFQFLMIVVAVVITILSFGQGAQALGAALALGSGAAISAAVMTLLENLLIKFLEGQLFKLFVKAVGLEGTIVFLVAAAYFQNGAGLLTAGSAVANAPWADTLLQLGSGLMKAIQIDLEDKMAGISKEFQDLAGLQEQFNTELTRANNLLESKSHLSPFVIFGEKPDDFYNRTIHAGNTGQLAIGAISSYVEIALSLPKLNDTVGEEFYV